MKVYVPRWKSTRSIVHKRLMWVVVLAVGFWKWQLSFPIQVMISIFFLIDLSFFLIAFCTTLDFHGIDLRTMFPSTIKPQNTTFLQHDFLMNLPYPDESFEFVRMRSMLGFMTQPQLLLVLAEIQRVLKPSGYIEILDVEYKIHRPGPISESVLNQQCKGFSFKQGGYKIVTIL